MPECLWKFRVKDFGPLTVGDRLARQLALPRRPGRGRRSDWRISMPGSDGFLDLPPARRSRASTGAHARDRQGAEPARDRGPLRHGRRLRRHRQARLGHVVRDQRTSRRRSRSTARSRRRSSAAGRSSRPSSPGTSSTSTGAGSTENRFSHVEVSDGTIDLPHERKLELIAELARDFVVLSGGRLQGRRGRLRALPVGRVDARGARRRRLEGDHRGREGGTAGIFRPTGEMRTGLIDEIVHEIDVGDIIFEAPTKASQAWFVRSLRARGQPREHPARGGHPARDAAPRAPRRHPQGGAPLA